MNTTRRQFLMTGMSASTLALTGMGRAAAAERPRWRCGLGLNGFMSSGQEFQKTYPLWEILDFATREGFHGIELVEGWPQGGYPGADEKQRIAALKRLYDAYGLRVYTIQTGGSGAYAADEATRLAWMKTFTDRISLCQQLGCDFIGNWPGGGLEGNPDVDHAIERLATSYREAAKRCADAGMHLSFEIEPPFVFNTLDHLKRILAAVDHPACKTNYDTSHFDLMSGSKGKPEDMLKQLGVQHIGHVHLTDTDGTIFKGTSKHLPCGEGHCDIAASLRTLKEGGYQGWIMIDAWLTEDPYHASHNGKQAIDAACALP